MRILNTSTIDNVDEAVFFPFDENSVPFTRDLLMNLQSGRTNKAEMDYGHNIDMDDRHPEGPVVTYGPPGSPDSTEVLSPNVFFHNGEYRMYYLGSDDDRKRRTGLYATSKDGFNWEKPNLGLREMNGNKNNNLVEEDCGEWVLYEPEDEKYPFKSVSSNGENTAVSEDGLHWTATGERRRVFGGIKMEIASIYKWDGCYYINGQNGPSAWTRSLPHPISLASKRTVITFASYDLKTWTHAPANSFRRDPIPPEPPENFECHAGEQIHEGMVPWNRGNVLLSLYGQYHSPSNDRRDVITDLGFAISHNGLHFKEPIPDFQMVHSYEIRGPKGGDFAAPRLMHNSWANIGDRTVIWFSIWREESSVWLDGKWSLDNPRSLAQVWVATWERDRLGFFKPCERDLSWGSGDYEPHFVTCPVDLDGKGEVAINADRLNAHSQLRVELLDREFRPIPGYSGDDCIVLDEPGLRLPARWRAKDKMENFGHPVRVRVNWEGMRPEDARVFAVYVN